MCPSLDIFTTHLYEVCFLRRSSFLYLTDYVPVRCLPPGAPDFVTPLKSPFVIEGARNVFLETVKRGEYDSFDDPVNFEHKDTTSTIILRLYEAYGGHAQVKLVISEHLPVLQVFTTNLLEDDVEGLYFLRDDGIVNGNSSSSYGGSVSLSFRGFEVKTIKLVLGALPPNGSHKKMLVPFPFVRCCLGVLAHVASFSF